MDHLGVNPSSHVVARYLTVAKSVHLPPILRGISPSPRIKHTPGLAWDERKYISVGGSFDLTV